MSREDISKLLGGYAAGTLTAEERQALFEAALEDQELFDELVREQPMVELLRDPAARTRVLEALEDARTPWYASWWRPALAMGAAAAIATGVYVARRNTTAERPAVVAEVRPAARSAAPPAPEAAPEPPAVSPTPRAPGKRATAKPKAEAPGAEAEMAANAPASVAAPAPPPPPAAQAGPVPTMALPHGRGSEGNDSYAKTRDAAPAPRPAPEGARTLFYSAAENASSGVSAGAISMQTGNALRARISPAMAPVGAAHLGLKYTVERQTPEGAFAEANPAELQADDTVRLRFEANDAGYLQVLEAADSGDPRLIVTARLERNRPFETPPWKSGAPGSRDFIVWFSREPAGPQFQKVEDIRGGLANAAAAQSSEAAPREGGTYVVDRSNQSASQRVVFSIRLTFR